MAARVVAAERPVHTNEEERAPASGSSAAKELEEEILDLLPALRAYGLSLARSTADADDLVQETLLKALANAHRFQRGTNLRAWLFTIERNTFYSEYRRRKREIPGEAEVSGTIGDDGAQEWAVELDDVKDALAALPSDQRDAVVLVGGIGLSYEEAASICDCPLGTIKSRVNRGRTGLQKILEQKPRSVSGD